MAAKKDIDLKKLIASEISAAQSDDKEQAKKRADALDYYQGTMSDVLSEAGRSSVVSRDLADTVGWMLPGIIRVFTASDHMAIAEPVGEEDMEYAKQATENINFVFWKDNPGYRIVQAATWDALVGADGIIKAFWDDTPEHAVSTHSNKTPEEIIALFQNESDKLDDDAQKALRDIPKLAESGDEQEAAEDDRRIEVLAFTPNEPLLPPDPDGFVWGTTNDIKIRRLKSPGRTIVECIAREDYLKDGDALTCQDARFQAHRRERTRSQLVEMGFDRDEVDDIGRKEPDDTEEAMSRDPDTSSDSTADRSMEIIDLYECYVKVDVDDDGIAETVRAYYAGNKGGGQLLKMEGMDEPFCCLIGF